jgi:glycosyltransferase involved in cell wall biosynthesis
MSARDVDVLLPGIVGGTGGAAVVMLDLAVKLAARGIRPKIVVPDVESTRPYVLRCEAEGIPAESCASLLPRENRLLGLADASRFLHGYASAAPVVHYHFSENLPPHLLLHTMNVLHPPRSFVTMHAPHAEPAPSTHAAQQWRLGAPRHFHRVICVSDWACDLQRSYGLPESLLQHIPNGVDLRWVRAGNGEGARSSIGASPDQPIITVVARLAPQKRPLDAMHAFEAIASEFPDALLVYIGGGELEAELRASVTSAGLQQRVHILGHRSDVTDWLAASTVWLLPSESEGLSIAVIEALAAGCAIAATQCAGNTELLIDGQNALLTPVGDVPAIANVLRRLLADPSLRVRLARCAREAAQRYDIDRTVDAYLDCYAASVPPALWVRDGIGRGPRSRENTSIASSQPSRDAEPDAPLVSVIIPAYEMSRFIGATLDSVLQQSFRNFEIIVVDDGSSDGEQLLAAIRARDDDIRYIRQQNGGPSSARNTALRAARGRYVAFLDGDDRWAPTFLAEQVRFLTEHQLDLVYADAWIQGDPSAEGRTFMQFFPSTGSVNVESLVSGSCRVVTSTVVVDREAVLRSGLFDESLRYAEDLDLWIRLAQQGTRMGYQRVPLMYRCVHDGNLTGDVGRLLLGVLEVLGRVRRSPVLSLTERASVEGAEVRVRSELALLLGKQSLAQGDFAGAIAGLADIHPRHRSWKTLIALTALRISPSTVYRVYKFRERHGDGSRPVATPAK